MTITKFEKPITKIGIISLAALAVIGVIASIISACEIDLYMQESAP